MTQIGPVPYGAHTALNITTATVVKASSGVLYAASVFGTGASAIFYDASTTGGAVAANEIGAITAPTVQPAMFGWQCAHGILVVPSAGAVSVSYT